MDEPYNVTVVGAGAMGHGLAVQFAVTGQDVTLVDHREENINAAKRQIRKAVTFLREQELAAEPLESVIDRIDFSLDTETAVANADVVLETISEDLEAKRDLFGTVVAAAPDEAVFASNTSSIPIGDIALATSDHADRIAGCHWWYPPYLLTPVEVVRGPETADETIDKVRTFVKAVDRDPVLVKRDAPGFVWNRVQLAVIRECLHIVEAGIASIDGVNRAIRDGYATRTAAIGPFETMDIAGLDLFETVATELYPELTDADRPQAELRDRVREGRIGIDAGIGFFDYDDPPEAATRRRDEKVAAIQRSLNEASE